MADTHLSELRAELSSAHHDARIRRMVELGRRAPEEPRARALLDGLASGDAYERRLALAAQYTRRDGAHVLRATTDESSRIRTLAFKLVPLACDDTQALEALRMAYAMRRETSLLLGLARHGRQAVIDLYLEWLSTRSVPDFADAVPLGTPAAIRRHLARALEKPSHRFWARLDRFAPAILAEVLAARLKAVPGEPDPVTRQRLSAHLGRLADQVPDAALELFDLLLARRTQPDANAWGWLVLRRPEAAVALLQRHKPSLLPQKLFDRVAPQLSEASLTWLIRQAPGLLGDAKKLLRKLPEAMHRAAAEAWSAAVDVAPAWGTELLSLIPDATVREHVYSRWSVASRNHDGVIAVSVLRALPLALREREARRHLHEVVALGTRPNQRMEYARLLPWDEAQSALQTYIGHPEGGVRGAALSALLALPGLRPDEPGLVERALPLVLARKNEQDPVRAAMLGALAQWPRRVWRREHTEAVGRMLRDALDAADLSQHTAQLAETLLLRTFAKDPAWGAVWLGTLLKERGTLHNPRLGDHLTDDEVRAAAPQLLAIAQAWAQRERGGPLLYLVQSLGERVALVPGLSEQLMALSQQTPESWLALGITQWLSQHDRKQFEATVGVTVRRWWDRGWRSSIVALASSEEEGPLHIELISGLERVALYMGDELTSALNVLHTRAVTAFERLLPALLKSDASVVCLPVVHNHMHRRRQDLLTPFLGAPVLTGRFASGKTRWLVPFHDGFFRWTPAQCTTYAQVLGELLADRERDTPTLLWATVLLAKLDWAPMDGLCALADDSRPAVQEKAIRVMARCDQGQGVPTLLRCLEDARARMAIYGLRRAFNGMPPSRVVALLATAPMNKVTVAKEVVRLLGELRSDAAYERLLALDATNLHRDVRIAMLRALWDHLDREPTWAVFARAVEGADWVMASRLGDIPADRLTAESDRKLSALLGRVLARPEPEARIDLLQRAALLAVKDPERTFLSACGARLGSPHDDEVTAAMRAILYRSDERDMERLEEMLSAVMADRRALSVAVGSLGSMRVKSRAVYVQAALAAERVLSRDVRLAALRVRCAAAALEPRALAQKLVEMGEAGHLHADALLQCRSAVEGLPAGSLEEVEAMLSVSPSEEARRVAVWCLVHDAGPGRGWTPERLARLARFQDDPSPLVSGAAQAVFPPREMVKSGPSPSR